MALIPCPQCGEPVSDNAEICPRCGASADTTIQGAPRGLLIQVIVRVVFAVLMGIFLWVTLRHLMEQTMPPTTDTPPPQVQPH